MQLKELGNECVVCIASVVSGKQWAPSKCLEVSLGMRILVILMAILFKIT